ncbi:hypothetical protein FOZ62_004024 [Perkinsus olseni]|uniref:Uncharacterized protein n=1 Tax=Perkinsus olseni TaxID=32597 RepID=A0A7J6SZT1_PEROL|nr:hypothetical protein FOZ62_004024 [Perkinsus olseni]
MRIAHLLPLVYTCLSDDSIADSEASAEFSAAGYPVPVGGAYQKPVGLCTGFYYQISGCYCDYMSEPVTFTNAGYSVGAICAPKYCSSQFDCPAGPHGTVQVCAKGKCHLGCHKDYNCPWPARCEHTFEFGDVCFYPQWQD